MMASNHYSMSTIKKYSESMGYKYISACNKDEFLKNISTFLNYNDAPIIFECFVNQTDEQKALEIL